MKQGDFSKLAKQYINRPAYSRLLIENLLKIFDYEKKAESFHIVEVGAGTGKLTKMLLEMGLQVTAVEPNSAMREEGIIYTQDYKNVTWLDGSGEETNVKSSCADWVIMASSFHWTDYNKSLPEFHRILKEGGFFTAVWNPRNIGISEFHTKIENQIKEIVPELNRVSSGSQSAKQWEYILVSTGHFKNCFFMETDYEEIMTRARYLGAWESVNDIQSQAGEKRWEQILSMIEKETENMDEIYVPYKIKAWTAQKK